MSGGFHFWKEFEKTVVPFCETSNDDGIGQACELQLKNESRALLKKMGKSFRNVSG